MVDEYKARREKLAANFLPASIAILPGSKLQYRNSDVEYPFRQSSDFYYLTGFSEPEACLVLSKDLDNQVKYILFSRPRDPEAEVWSGRRAGQQGAREIFGADEAHPIAELHSILRPLLMDAENLYCPLSYDLSSWHNVPKTVVNILPIIHEMRLIKSPQEIDNMRKAAQVSAQAHKKIMQACKPNMMEYQLEAIFIDHCMQEGCRDVAYSSIVASGNNACTLHYVENNCKIAAKDLVLIDAGCEYQNYAADITRTIPASGKFSAEQKAIYALVLQAQEAGIAQIAPGNTLDKVQNAILDVIVPGLVELNILHGDPEQLIASKAYKKFYMHSSGHWLGLDVHDAGEYMQNKQWREFEPGMVLTVEPGIYINQDCESVEPKWRGIGVRIEDDILVTKAGYEILSKDAPKQITEIERAAL